MSSNYLDQLLNLIASPVGLVGIVVSLFLFSKGKHDRNTAWLIFSFCAFCASLNFYTDQWILVPPPLVFPLQQIRAAGRPLTIGFLAILILIGLSSNKQGTKIHSPKAIQYLFFVQTIVFFKNFTTGDMGFALLAFITFLAILFMLKISPGYWIQDDENFELAVKALAMVSVIFLTLNFYQSIFDYNAISFTHGRLLGTTGNPQHAGTLLAITVPCYMFLIEKEKSWGLSKGFWIFALGCNLIALYLTGSRTGVLMAVSSILFFYRRKPQASILFLIPIGAMLFFLFSQLSGGAIEGLDVNTTVDRYDINSIANSNTREGVWAAQWDGFTNNLLFGTPLRSDRLGYGENSWLAVAAGLGLMGFIPLIIFGLESFSLVRKVSKIDNPHYVLHTDTFTSGMASIFVGSFFEGFLLGNLSFPLIAMLTYLYLGNYLLNSEEQKVKNTSTTLTGKSLIERKDLPNMS